MTLTDLENPLSATDPAVIWEAPVELGPMPSNRRKRKPFRAASAVRAVAREAIGTPPATRIKPSDKRRQSTAEKHKPTLGKLLSDAGDG